MNAYKLALFAWYGLLALVGVVSIGRQRKPITPGEACINLVLLAGAAALVYNA